MAVFASVSSYCLKSTTRTILEALSTAILLGYIDSSLRLNSFRRVNRSLNPCLKQETMTTKMNPFSSDYLARLFLKAMCLFKEKTIVPILIVD